MQVEIVGAHQSETEHRKFTTILVDHTLAVDAGSLAGGLSADAQSLVRDVLLTHQHWDHVKDLAGFGFNLLGRNETSNVYCTDEVRRVVSANLLNPNYWIGFFDGPNPNRPVFRHQRVEFGSEFGVGTYRVLSVPVNHSVPTTGYQITDGDGRKLYYTSDNGPGCGSFWVAARPDVLITECTYSNVQAEDARQYGHLCPSALEAALVEFRSVNGYLPRVILVHLNPMHEERIGIEVAEIAQRLQAAIEVGWEGFSFAV